MAFKLTYSDGQESEYGDDTAWDIEAGVLKMGREQGEWTVLLSPSHWAVIEVAKSGGNDESDDEDGDEKDDDA
jgi:hypothetical protein